MSRISQSRVPIYTALIGVISALAGTWLGAYLTSSHAFRNQRRIAIYEMREQSYAELMGGKILLQQLYVSRFEALIFSDYHERRWHLRGDPDSSLDLDEAKRWMRKSEDFSIEIARTYQSLLESVGTARVAFPRSDELDRLSDAVYRFKTPKVKPAPPDSDDEELKAWKVDAVHDLQDFVKREYGEPIDGLLEYMRNHLQDPLPDG